MALDPSLERALFPPAIPRSWSRGRRGARTERGGGRRGWRRRRAPPRTQRPTSRSSSPATCTRRRHRNGWCSRCRTVVPRASSTRAGLRSRSGSAVPAARGSPLTPTAYDRAGLPKGRGVYVARPTFDQPGVWRVEARAQGQKVPFTLQVNDAPVTVVPGMPAPRAASPTTTASLGVDPICTRDPRARCTRCHCRR